MVECMALMRGMRYRCDLSPRLWRRCCFLSEPCPMAMHWMSRWIQLTRSEWSCAADSRHFRPWKRHMVGADECPQRILSRRSWPVL